MNRRVEFALNLDDPTERAIYETLTAPLRHRRAGELIRNALVAFLLSDNRQSPLPSGIRGRHPITGNQAVSVEPLDAAATAQIVDRSASMFGF